jgi:threonine aldolase
MPTTSGARWERLQAVVAVAREHGLRLHLDGARLFNAEVASGIAAARWAEPFDTVSFCLSKGLGAPVGSLVCGSAATVDRLHRVRKMLGGGMRQAGILAAAGLYALEHNVARLADDHANAARLARGLVARGLTVEPFPETNIVLFSAPDDEHLATRLRQSGILVNAVGPGRFRAVTHLDVTSGDVDEALQRIGGLLA